MLAGMLFMEGTLPLVWPGFPELDLLEILLPPTWRLHKASRVSFVKSGPQGEQGCVGDGCEEDRDLSDGSFDWMLWKDPGCNNKPGNLREPFESELEA